jgi:RNA polymerase sigma factor (sigma-70 family)
VEADNPFVDLVRRARAGDEEAAARLVRDVEPVIRREVRFRLRDTRVRRQLDSMDVCQSVLANFFVRVAAGQYDLQEPADLIKLLVTMTRNKIAERVRQQHRQRRDSRRTVGEVEGMAVVGNDPTPSRVASGKELLDAVRGRLGDEERRLAEMRGEGLGWDEIAARLGGTANARRMQLARAVERVARQLGLVDDHV